LIIAQQQASAFQALPKSSAQHIPVNLSDHRAAFKAFLITDHDQRMLHHPVHTEIAFDIQEIIDDFPSAAYSG
jgi:hypothetical protein